MNIIRYQFAEPEEILSLDNSTFELLLHEKIYRVNKRFVQSQACLLRLVSFVKNMEANLKNLKLVKDLIVTFQTTVLFFFKDFYTNSDVCFRDMVVKDQYDNENTIKRKVKFEILLQEISQIYKYLIDGLGKIEFFEFFNKYGTSNQQTNFTRTQLDYQCTYMRFLKKCFQQEIKIKDPNILPKAKYELLQRLQKQFESIVKDQIFSYFERLTFKTIFEGFLSLTESLKHAGKVLEIGKIGWGRFPNKQKRRVLELDPDDLETVKKISPCCRTFFYQNEQINHPENFTLEYKNYESPYDRYCTMNLRKAICAFLNRQGGIILVGIYQRPDKFKQVKGQFYSQNQKEEVMKDFRNVCSQIYPNIVSQAKYLVKFVPIKSADNDYVPGKYIIRVEIAVGDQKTVYTYKDGKGEYVAIRTANEVLKRDVNQQTLSIFKQMLLNPKKIHPIHQRPCPQPEAGEPTWRDRTDFYKKSYRNKKYLDKYEQRNSDEKLRGKKSQWKVKQQDQIQFQRQEKLQDFVYVNSDKEISQEDQRRQRLEFRFICDQDHQPAQKRENKYKEEEKSNNSPCQKQQQEITGLLDFRPLNPVVPQRIKPQLQKRKDKAQTIVQNQPILNRLEPNLKRLQSYKVEKSQIENEKSQRPISENRCLDILVCGYPFIELKKEIKFYGISLIEQPIECNHKLVTWIKVNILDLTNIEKIQLIRKTLLRKHEEAKITQTFKFKKVYNNIVFKDQILLNKLIHKFKHDQEFFDRRGCYYFKCRNNMQSIQAYTIGWEMNIKTQFNSDSELKKAKLQELALRAETR